MRRWFRPLCFYSVRQTLFSLISVAFERQCLFISELTSVFPRHSVQSDKTKMRLTMKMFPE